jgi:hypothetical protein
LAAAAAAKWPFSRSIAIGGREFQLKHRAEIVLRMRSRLANLELALCVLEKRARSCCA